jgi:acetoacetyl-CoA synthetase
LATGATLVLYEGSPFGRRGRILPDLIDEEQIAIFGVGAKYIDSLERTSVRPRETHNLASLRTILSTGSPLNRHSYEFIYRDFKADVCLSSISGGTDIISCFVLGNPALPVYNGEIQCLGLGMGVDIWNEQGESVRGEKGELVCTKPFPSAPIGFWNDGGDEKYRASYFSRFEQIWAHGDFGEITEQGGVIIHGRSDATLNPGGVRIGTAEIYRQVEKIETVVDSVVIGQQFQGDERVILFVAMADGVVLDDAVVLQIKNAIRDGATPRHVPAKIIAVPAIPRTISGKVVELAVKQIVHNQTISNRDALANPEALDYFAHLEALKS